MLKEPLPVGVDVFGFTASEGAEVFVYCTSSPPPPVVNTCLDTRVEPSAVYASTVSEPSSSSVVPPVRESSAEAYDLKESAPDISASPEPISSSFQSALSAQAPSTAATNAIGMYLKILFIYQTRIIVLGYKRERDSNAETGF